MRRFASAIQTPLGQAIVQTNTAGAVISLSLSRRPTELSDVIWDEGAGAEVRKQLTQYFAGQRQVFDLALSPQGTAFRQKVWQALCTIPYGETRSYGQLARQIGAPQSARAVGQANHHNPIWIIIPCHRVIGQSGHLTGYAGGIDVKKALLDLEKRHAPTSVSPLFELADLR